MAEDLKKIVKEALREIAQEQAGESSRDRAAKALAQDNARKAAAKNRKFKVETPSLVPLEFRPINEKLIDEAVKGGATNIPGVLIIGG